MAGDLPIYVKFALSDLLTYPFRKRQFLQISLNSAYAVTAGKIINYCVTPKSHNKKGGTRFCCFFPVKFNFGRKKSAAKFLCLIMTNSGGKVVATSFLYLTVHR